MGTRDDLLFYSDSAATADSVHKIQETRLHGGNKQWSMDSMGTLPEQLSTRPETGDYDVLQCLLVQVQNWFVQFYYQIQD